MRSLRNVFGWLGAGVRVPNSTLHAGIPALGRKAHPADKERNPGELPAAEIEKLIAANRGAWAGWARKLHATALEAVAAVDARDPEKLLDVGGALDTACEGCHKQFWYPNQEQ